MNNEHEPSLDPIQLPDPPISEQESQVHVAVQSPDPTT